MSELPEGWEACRLGDILDGIHAGKSVRCDERPPEGQAQGLVKISAVSWGRFNEVESKTLLTDEGLDQRSKICVGDLLISRANTLELVGAPVIVHAVARNLYLSDKVLRLELPEALRAWVLVCLKTKSGRKQIEALATGNQLSMRNISQDALRSIEMPLPPVAEQKRIAQKLDALLAQVDTLKARIDAIPALLKRFRQSTLAAAMSGRLTGIAISADVALSDCGNVTGGITKNAKRSSMDLVLPYLRVANVQAGHLDLSDVSAIGVSAQEAEKTRLQSGDILIVEGNGSLEHIGRAAMWRGEIDQCCHQNHLIRWRRNGAYLPDLVLIYLASPQGRGALVKVAKSTTGLHTLSISKVSSLRIPLLDLHQQTEIVRRVEQLFAFADQLEAKVTIAKRRIDTLTQSILAKAFRGELEPQDPADESASVLLERIRTQRTAAPKPRRGRKTVSST